MADDSPLSQTLLALHQYRLSLGLRSAQEVNGSIDTPDGRNAQCEERLLECAQIEEGTDEVEGHASQIGKKTKARNEQV